MKVAGIIFLILGISSLLIAVIGAAYGYSPASGGIMLIVLGAFMISRANKKAEEERKKQDWLNGKTE